jgi:hypothetical protein
MNTAVMEIGEGDEKESEGHGIAQFNSQQMMIPTTSLGGDGIYGYIFLGGLPRADLPDCAHLATVLQPFIRSRSCCW